jgi:hypothetical protein
MRLIKNNLGIKSEFFRGLIYESDIDNYHQIDKYVVDMLRLRVYIQSDSMFAYDDKSYIKFTLDIGLII